MKSGDPCSIWSGNSPISDPKNWLFGVVVKVKIDKDIGKKKYQAIWNDLSGADKTWYDENDIKLENLEGRW